MRSCLAPDTLERTVMTLLKRRLRTPRMNHTHASATFQHLMRH
jgi:hypothetical protein